MYSNLGNCKIYSSLLPTTSLMPGTSAMVHYTMSAPAAAIGHVLSTLVIVSTRTTCTSVAPMSTQPSATTVTTASPYAASLLPK